MERLNEITFNASLLRELRAIDFVNRMLDEGRLDPERYRRNRLHRIDATDGLAHHTASTKMDTRWRFFVELRDAGREAAAAWLDRHYADVGVRSTVDLQARIHVRAACRPQIPAPSISSGPGSRLASAEGLERSSGICVGSGDQPVSSTSE